MLFAPYGSGVAGFEMMTAFFNMNETLRVVRDNSQASS